MNFRNLLGFWPRAFRLMLVNGEIFADQQIRNTKTALTGFVIFQIVFVTVGCIIANRWNEEIGATIVSLSSLMVMLIIVYVFAQFSILLKAADVAQKAAINAARAANVLVPGEPIDPKEILDSKQTDKGLNVMIASMVVVLYVDVLILVLQAWFYPGLLQIMTLAGVAVSMSAVTWGGVRAWLPIIQKTVYILLGAIIVGGVLMMANPGGFGSMVWSYRAAQNQARVLQRNAAVQDAFDLIDLDVLAKERNALIRTFDRNEEQEKELDKVNQKIGVLQLRHEEYVATSAKSTSMGPAGIWLRQNQQIVVGGILLLALIIFLSKWKGGKSESNSGSVSTRTMVIIAIVVAGLWWFSPLLMNTASDISDAYPLRGGPKMQEPDGRRAPANLTGGDWEKVVDMTLDPKLESQDTKFVAQPGDELYIMAKGTVKCDPRWKQAVSLDGTTISETGLTFVCPEALMGQLLVMTPGEVRPVGTRRQVKVQNGGPISVGINDLVGWYGDNTATDTRVVILRKKRDGQKLSARNATTTSESSNRWLALFILYRNITFYDIIFL